MVLQTIVAPSKFPRCFWKVKGTSFPPSPPEPNRSLLLPPPNIPSSFGLGCVVFLLLLSKLEEHRWQIWAPLPWWWPWSVVPTGAPRACGSGASQWRIRLGQDKGASSPNPALLNLAELQLFRNWLLLAPICEARMGLPEQDFFFGGGAGGSPFLCAYRNHFRACVTMVSGKKIQFSGDVHDPRYCHGGSPNNPGILMLCSRRDFFFKRCNFHPSLFSLPQARGYANPC